MVFSSNILEPELILVILFKLYVLYLYPEYNRPLAPGRGNAYVLVGPMKSLATQARLAILQ